MLGVGGTTLHYQGEAHRFTPAAFRTRSVHGFGVDWPVGHDELVPYYERVEHLLGVAGDPGNPFKAPRGPFPTPAHPSYPSAHSCISGGMTETLARTFPSERDRLEAVAQEASLSRLYAGIHYRFDMVAGLGLGRAVAAKAWQLNLDEVAPLP